MRIVDRAINRVATNVDIYKREQRLQNAGSEMSQRLHLLFREHSDKRSLEESALYLESQAMLYYMNSNPYTKHGIAMREHAAGLMRRAMKDPDWNDELEAMHKNGCEAVDAVIELRAPKV